MCDFFLIIMISWFILKHWRLVWMWTMNELMEKNLPRPYNWIFTKTSCIIISKPSSCYMHLLLYALPYYNFLFCWRIKVLWMEIKMFYVDKNVQGSNCFLIKFYCSPNEYLKNVTYKCKHILVSMNLLLYFQNLRLGIWKK